MYTCFIQPYRHAGETCYNSYGEWEKKHRSKLPLKNPTHFLRSNSRCCSYLRICWKTLCAWSLPHFWNFHTNENIAYMKMLISRNNIMNSISIDQIFSMDSLSSGQRNSANDTNTHTRSRWAQKKTYYEMRILFLGFDAVSRWAEQWAVDVDWVLPSLLYHIDWVSVYISARNLIHCHGI